MPRRLLPFVCLWLLSAPLCGCWAMDEIDKGEKWMDDHSEVQAKAAKEKENAKDQAPGPAPAGRVLDAYFSSQAKEGKTHTITPGQVSEGIVACKLGRSTQFMTRENCAARGGNSG